MKEVIATVADGKYTVGTDQNGRVIAYRYGEPWRDCCGDGLIYWLSVELKTAREELEKVKRQLQREPLQVWHNEYKGIPFFTPVEPAEKRDRFS